VLSVTDQRLDDPIKEFELVHDKLMHVIIVGEDLSYFVHIHPTIRSGNDDSSIFTITHIFPNSGKYKLWVDFKPKGGNQIIAAFKFTLQGSLFIDLKNSYTMESISINLWMANIKLA
jgi:hypothetical protein